MTEKFEGTAEPTLPLPPGVLGVSFGEADRHFEDPNFGQYVAALEQIAANGIETPRGKESYIFRAGIEVEFRLCDPEKVKAYLENEDISERMRAITLAEMRNPDLLDGRILREEAKLAPYRAQAKAMIEALPAMNEAEEKKRHEWLRQVDAFTIGDIINFRLYSEFSKPTLSAVIPPKGDLQKLDEFSEQQGWVEFRFGKSTLQRGYYDNEGISEVRIAPTTPSEALRREEVVMTRATEIASEYGVMLASDVKRKDINVSAYITDEGGNALPVIGHGEDRRERTIDITSGVAAAYEDGLLLHAKEVPKDFMFGSQTGQLMELAPTRKSLRILEGRLELRTNFSDVGQGMNALLAGAIYGLQQGSEALQAVGHAITEGVDVLKVNRTDDFVKNRDILIQRTFEEAEQAEGGSFMISTAWNWHSGAAFTGQLIGKTKTLQWCNVFNDFVLSAVRLDHEGKPFIDNNALKTAEQSLSAFSREALKKFMSMDDIVALAPHINERLAVIRLERVTAIKGNARYVSVNREEAFGKVVTSPIAELAYQGGQNGVADWLRKGQTVYDYLRA